MKQVPFSQCAVWTDQIAFFRTQGIEAWQRQVPYNATNHISIASSYAQILWNFFSECRQRGDSDPEQPFYVIELGSGIGKFGFYFLKQMAELSAQLPQAGIHFRYLMTDISESNLRFLKQHPALHEFVATGVLDFACFNPLEHDSLHLESSSLVFAAGPHSERFSNPVVIVANYFFDSLPVDLFRVTEQDLEVALAVPGSRMASNDSMNKTVSLADHGIEVDYAPVGLPFYRDPDFDAVLQTYVEHTGQGYFAFPIGGLRCLRHMYRLAQGRLLAIVSDKGVLPQHEAIRRGEPKASLHGGNLTFTVNFPLLSRYIEQLGGGTLSQQSQQNISTVLFNTTANWSEFPASRYATHQFLDVYGHYSLFQQYAILRKGQEQLKLTAEQLLSLFNLVQWDPLMVLRLWPAIRKALNLGTEIQRMEFARGIELSASYHYHLPTEELSILEAASTFFRWFGDTVKADDYALRAENWKV